MDHLNTDIQSDMKIDVRITWADIFAAVLDWVMELIMKPLRASKSQPAPKALRPEIH